MTHKKMKNQICNFLNNERIKIAHEKEESNQITCTICKKCIKINELIKWACCVLGNQN